MIQKLKYYINAIRWLWEHKQEPNNRQKWRRMMREVGERREEPEKETKTDHWGYERLFCPNCKAQYTKGQRFCDNCGQKLI